MADGNLLYKQHSFELFCQKKVALEIFLSDTVQERELKFDSKFNLPKTTGVTRLEGRIPAKEGHKRKQSG